MIPIRKERPNVTSGEKSARRWMTRTLWMLAAAAIGAPPVSAQSMRDAIERLFIFGQCGEPVCLDVSAEVHGQHYKVGAGRSAEEIVAFLQQSIGSSLASVPLPSSNSGQLFRVENGQLVATESSAGPIYLERSQTLGRGTVILGANMAGISLSNLRGESLDDLTLNFTHQDVGIAGLGDPDWENDFIRVTTDLDLDLLITSFFLMVGVSPSVDVGLAVPLVKASLRGGSTAEIVPWNAATTPHAFLVEGVRSLVSSSAADQSGSGIGDIAIRVKANATQRESVGFAFVGELRLPTGEEENFRGTGETSVRVLGAVSGRAGNLAPHLNAGVTARSGELQPTSITVLTGVDALLRSNVTTSVELIGDFLVESNSAAAAVTRVEDYRFPRERTLSVSGLPSREDHVIDVVGGLKVEPFSNFRMVGSVLVPLYEGGARPSVQWTLGMEAVF
jgi:hypothetical protein